MQQIKKIIKAIDFFCSGGGMTYGIRQAGIEVIAGIDIDKKAKETYEKNNPGSKFLCRDISKYTVDELKKDLKKYKNFDLQRKDNNLIFIGCSPCQYWSLINRKKESSEKSKNLLREFQRFVEYYKPGFVIVENVPGLERNAEESGLKSFTDMLKSKGYSVNYKVYDLREYGVPQTRKRFSLIASRIIKDKIEPEKADREVTVREAIGNKNKFPPIEAGYRDPDKKRFHSAAGLSRENLEALKKTEPGGPPAKRRKKFKEKGFIDSYGRMEWDKPAPTITTKFFSLSNGRFGHPEQHRALSIREGATLQTFPYEYEFVTDSLTVAARIIGNAVPPEFARRIGEAIIKGMKNGK